MIDNPAVSVVIPTYNRAHLIGRTIDSVLAQSFEDFEIIIVDDFSSDFEDLQRIVESYGNDNIRLLRHTINRHGSAARNTGIKAARGKYLALLDSDDLWLPHKLEQCIKQNIGVNDVLYSQLHNADGVFPSAAIKENALVGDYLFLNNGCMQTSTLFMHMALARSVLFDESLTRFQDYDFVIRLQAFGAKFVFIQQILVQMCDDDNGSRISNNVSFKPAVFWLNKIIPLLSIEAAMSFYSNRVVRLMVLDKNQRKILSLLPTQLQISLPLFTRFKLFLLSLMPNVLFTLARAGWLFIKKLKQAI